MAEDDSILGLATIRRNRGISLEQISESTKISMRSLRAIESGEFQKLPGGIYNTNYIRQYAKAIDFDEAELLAFYRSHSAAREPEILQALRNSNGMMRGGYRPASITS